MSKWNKPVLSDEFLRNEERRKQMIIEAARRRKEKLICIQLQQEAERKKQEEALEKYRLQKQETYTKYLKNNNLHDKYEAIKRDVKEKQTQDISAKKWNKHKKQEEKIKSFKETVREEYQLEWEEPKKYQQKKDEELICSRLLDSLDLDIGTVNREKEVKNLLNQMEVNKIRDMIGYESHLFVKQMPSLKSANRIEIKKHSKQAKQYDEEQMIVALRNKKQAKILEWAIEEKEEADDLFSNCSSKVSEQKMKKTQQPLKKVLEPIIEARVNGSKKTSKSSSVQKVNKSIKKDETKVKVQNPKLPPPSKLSKNKTVNHISSTVEEKNFLKKKSIEKVNEKTIEKNSQKSKQNLEQNQPFFEKDVTQMTCEERFGIDSFIKHELLNLNEEETEVQKQLKVIHENHKKTVKEVEKKYQINTNYKHSYEVTGASNKTVANKDQDENDIQESIQRLDDYLMRKEIQKEKQIIHEEKSEVSFKKSKINPLCDPFELQAQVLSFAENISKTVIEGGYGEKYKEKKQNKKDEKQITKIKKESQDSLEQKLERPPSIFYEIQTGAQKIKVNENLKQLLLQ